MSPGGPALTLGLLPCAAGPVVSATYRGDGAALRPSADEPGSLVRASPSRVADFRRGRVCARAALEGLGLEPERVPSGRDGEPLWPIGVSGSITHCRGFACAAVTQVRALVGVDAEPAKPLPKGVLELVTGGPERSHLASMARRHPTVPWDTVLFSAKEAVYKALFPLTRLWLDFTDVAAWPSVGGFDVQLQESLSSSWGLPATLQGHWAVDGGTVLTTLVVDSVRPTEEIR